jgi:hypothetical protein
MGSNPMFATNNDKTRATARVLSFLVLNEVKVASRG